MNDLALVAPQIGVSERTLRRALAEGSIRGRRLSPRRLQLSASEKDYLLRRWSLLAHLRAAFRTEPNVRLALLFGSAARGDDNAESDIDLLVEMRDPSLIRLVDLELKLERLLEREVQVLTLADAQENPLLFATASVEGRVIVDRDSQWPSFSAEGPEAKRRAEQEVRRRARHALDGIDELLAQHEPFRS
jgi:predicted nucleotidyltransferase